MYEQLREQFSAAVACGALLRGEKLPGVRSLATQLSINPNTVNRAYAELERGGIVVTRRGLGTFVAAKPKGERGAQRRKLAHRADRFVAESVALGCQSDDVVVAVRTALERQARLTGYAR